ncbi:MAG TPA: hypothetical protein PK867_10145, partial [Pirellulales bacterium]|nr:hypothetical protein [Pirellulales bacterium]
MLFQIALAIGADGVVGRADNVDERDQPLLFLTAKRLILGRVKYILTNLFAVAESALELFPHKPATQQAPGTASPFMARWSLVAVRIPPKHQSWPMSERVAVVLAAGKGTRMKSDL